MTSLYRYRYNRTMLSHSVKQLRYLKMSKTYVVPYCRLFFQIILSVLMIRSPDTDLVGSDINCTVLCMNFARPTSEKCSTSLMSSSCTTESMEATPPSIYLQINIIHTVKLEMFQLCEDYFYLILLNRYPR
jgi:hypothetical protein